jgi:predicted phosphodiesterase
MKLTYKDWPLGVVSDIHNHIAQLQNIFAANKDIKSWICLGDVVDFMDPADNRTTMDWWIKNAANIPTIRGNHEEVVCSEMFNITFGHQEIIRKQFVNELIIEFPNKQVVYAYHNKPKCNWSFIDKNKYTLREYIDDFANVPDDTRAILIGHNHSQFILNFDSQEAFPAIWSVGAAKDGNYAIIGADGIEMRKLSKS